MFETSRGLVAWAVCGLCLWGPAGCFSGSLKIKGSDASIDGPSTEAPTVALETGATTDLPGGHDGAAIEVPSALDVDAARAPTDAAADQAEADASTAEIGQAADSRMLDTSETSSADTGLGDSDASPNEDVRNGGTGGAGGGAGGTGAGGLTGTGGSAHTGGAGMGGTTGAGAGGIVSTGGTVGTGGLVGNGGMTTGGQGGSTNSACRSPKATNLLANPGFDSGTSGWRTSPGAVWQADDAGGCPASGSVKVAVTTPDFDFGNFSQCVSVAPNKNYYFGYRYKQEANAALVCYVILYPTLDCSGDTQVMLPVQGSQVDMPLPWTASQPTGVNTAGDTRSLEVRCQTTNTPLGYFDQLFLDPQNVEF